MGSRAEETASQPSDDRYELLIVPRAERDLALLFEAIHGYESKAAQRWYAKLKRAILTLERNPYRCPVTPESQRLRHLLHGRKGHVLSSDLPGG